MLKPYFMMVTLSDACFKFVLSMDFYSLGIKNFQTSGCLVSQSPLELDRVADSLPSCVSRASSNASIFENKYRS